MKLSTIIIAAIVALIGAKLFADPTAALAWGVGVGFAACLFNNDDD